MPIALSVLSAMGIVPQDELEELFVIGEINLKGEVCPINGILPMISEAYESGIRRCIVPFGNAKEAGLVVNMQIFAVKTISEVIGILNGEPFRASKADKNITYKEENGGMTRERIPDFAEINGQHVLKRACETAVSGMHNLLMIGPPGAGKTMAAMRIPTILPPLKNSEQMELSKIYSVRGLFSNRESLLNVRPFRCPHHTITPQALAGGGVVPRPGKSP